MTSVPRPNVFRFMGFLIVFYNFCVYPLCKKKMFIFILTFFFCYIVLHYIYIYNYYTIFKSYVTHKRMNIMPEKQAALGDGFLY